MEKLSESPTTTDSEQAGDLPQRRYTSTRQVKFDLNLRPFIVIWELTQACELACKHCRASASPERNPNELSTSEGKNLLDQISEFGLPKPVVVLTGGDPLIRPDIFEFIKYSRDLGLATAIAPSGTPRLTRNALSKIKKSGATSISLSIDGATPEVHDGFRGVEGSFETTVKAARVAKELELRLQFNTSLTKLNVTELSKIAILAHELKVVTWSLFLLVPTGRGVQLNGLNSEEVEDVFHFCVDLSSFLPIKVTEAPHFRRVLKMRQEAIYERRDWKQFLKPGKLYEKLSSDFEQLLRINDTIEFTDFALSDVKRPPLVINAGNGFMFVSAQGDVCPSGFLPKVAGNVRSTPLADIYRNSTIFTDLRNPAKLNGRCSVCEYLDICGGSRSRSFGITGDYEGDDPSCNHIPKASLSRS